MRSVEMYPSPDTQVNAAFDDNTEILVSTIVPSEVGITPGLVLPQNTPIQGELGTNAATPIVQPADLPDDPIVYEAPRTLVLDESATKGAEAVLMTMNAANPAEIKPVTPLEKQDLGNVATDPEKKPFPVVLALVAVVTLAAGWYLLKSK